MDGRKKLLIIFSAMASTFIVGSITASIVLYTTGNELKPIDNDKSSDKNENNSGSKMENK